MGEMLQWTSWEHKASEYYGRIIMSAHIKNNKLRLTLNGRDRIDIYDDGQSCCEIRYMRTDDDLNTLVGGKIIHIEQKPVVTESEDRYNTVESMFVEIATDKGFITLANYNEHNGYYGGFDMKIEPVEAD